MRWLGFCFLPGGERFPQARIVIARIVITRQIAHDFNNLLGVIQGYSECLLRRPDNDEFAARALRQIAEASERATALSRQLMALGPEDTAEPKVASHTRRSDHANQPRTKAKGSRPARGLRETILLVEDEPLLRNLVGRILDEWQYHVLEASSGPEARKVWDQHQGKIDLLLTDIVMPGGMTGHDLAAEFRRRKPKVKVILTSGYGSDDAGCDGALFLAKPYLPAQLAQTIRRCLEAT